MRLIKVIENKYIYKFKNNKKINYKLCTQHNAALHQKKKKHNAAQGRANNYGEKWSLKKYVLLHLTNRQ